MHPSYQQYGLTEIDAPYAAAFESWARKQGWPREQIEAAYAWYAAQPAGTDRDGLIDSFAAYSDEQGWPLAARDSALVWHGAVEDHGLEAALPEAPTAASDTKSLAQIARMMRENPEGYWADPDIQRTYYDALERQAGRDAGTVTKPSVDAQRRGEIERLMRDDTRAYWRDEAMQQEYASILSREHIMTEQK